MIVRTHIEISANYCVSIECDDYRSSLLFLCHSLFIEKERILENVHLLKFSNILHYHHVIDVEWRISINFCTMLYRMVSFKENYLTEPKSIYDHIIHDFLRAKYSRLFKKMLFHRYMLILHCVNSTLYYLF